MKKNILALFLEKLFDFPLWVKQVIFLKLHQNLTSQLSEGFITVDERQIFHLYTPVLSFMGRNELEEKKSGLDENIYNFLGNANDDMNMLEISLNNFWTMEEVAKYFIFCLEQDYLKAPESPVVWAMGGFIAGKFRTGEYFKRAGKINVEQLEKAILTQKDLANKGQNIKIAQVMISLGQVTEKDTTSLLIIKEESKKRFILNSSIVPELEEATGTSSEEIEVLRQQNAHLKQQLAKLLAFVKKNAK